MSSQIEPGGRRITITRHENGCSFKIESPDPMRQWMPVDERTARIMKRVSRKGPIGVPVVIDEPPPEPEPERKRGWWPWR